MQAEYTKYLEKTLSRIVTNIPNLDVIKKFLAGGADVNSYFIYDKYANPHGGRDLPGQTLLYGLVRIIPIFSGTKSRLNRITEMMEYILNHGADVEEGYAKIDDETREPLTGIQTPLTYAINNRITQAIRILLNHHATVYEFNKKRWLSYINQARNPNERNRLIEIMKLLRPGYVWQESRANSNVIEDRNIPYGAENAISYENIQNGDIMVNINNEYLGKQGVLGPHSHFYKKTSWDAWEKTQI